MNLVNEIDRLYSLTDLSQKLRTEVEHEIVSGTPRGPVLLFAERIQEEIVSAARALVEKADS